MLWPNSQCSGLVEGREKLCQEEAENLPEKGGHEKLSGTIRERNPVYRIRNT